VLYHSVSLQGADIAVSGLVLAPDRDAPPGGFPVVAWAHGTTGAADVCAPSRLGDLTPPLAGHLLRQGYVVAATDYEGLGTPGPHPYLVGTSEGRGVLDAARAAASVTDASTRVVVWGHSQGGHAALFAGEMAPWYAPDLEVVGVVSGAPVADVAALLASVVDVPGHTALVLTAVHAWAAVYPDADAADLLTPDTVDRLGAVERHCLFGVEEAFAEPLEQLRVGDPGAVEPWRSLLEENTPGRAPVAAPTLLIHGDGDALLPVEATAALADRLCRHGGGPVALRRYADADHSSVLGAAADDMFEWIAGRFEGREAPSTCGT
jgi:alpha-beta hydrolase superfamily lysophospholipase